MAPRSYRQICGVAQALDLLGERWTLLVIRELMLGPKRFGALKDALPGINANLLSVRLKSLIEAGVVEQVRLPAPASVAAYGLTERGEALRPTIDSLAIWGFDLLEPEEQSARGWMSRPSWLASTLAAAAEPGSLERVGPRTVNFDVDGDRFVVRSRGDRAEVRHGTADDADGALATDMKTFFAMTKGEESPNDPAAAAVLEALAISRPA
jgi:DNA-binding HxlR family transcriptional regulator